MRENGCDRPLVHYPSQSTGLFSVQLHHANHGLAARSRVQDYPERRKELGTKDSFHAFRVEDNANRRTLISSNVADLHFCALTPLDQTRCGWMPYGAEQGHLIT